MTKQTIQKTTKKTTAAKKTTSKARVARAKVASKVPASTIDPNFSPNKMGFAVASLAAVSLLLLGVVAMYG